MRSVCYDLVATYKVSLLVILMGRRHQCWLTDLCMDDACLFVTIVGMIVCYMQGVDLDSESFWTQV